MLYIVPFLRLVCRSAQKNLSIVRLFFHFCDHYKQAKKHWKDQDSYSSKKKLLFNIRMTDFCIQLLQNNFSQINFTSCNNLYKRTIDRDFSTWRDLEIWYKETLDPMLETLYGNIQSYVGNSIDITTYKQQLWGASQCHTLNYIKNKGFQSLYRELSIRVSHELVSGKILLCLRYIPDESPLYSKVVQECTGLVLCSDINNFDNGLLVFTVRMTFRRCTRVS
jgi:hypothetical protein